jgi:hypothetical protein
MNMKIWYLKKFRASVAPVAPGVNAPSIIFNLSRIANIFRNFQKIYTFPQKAIIKQMVPWYHQKIP